MVVEGMVVQKREAVKTDDKLGSGNSKYIGQVIMQRILGGTEAQEIHSNPHWDNWFPKITVYHNISSSFLSS